MPPLRPRPLPPTAVPPFAQVGRPIAGRSDLWSKPLILLIAVGIFVSFLSLLWELQHKEHLRVVEVRFMEEEAAEAEAALEAAGAGPAPASVSATSDPERVPADQPAKP
ncbi:MAG: hypothetical protein D6798_09530 [Deltaproteobacteria bacterium]|nr:MAG: hypothetical protein D6798_09530 [Deltaproteobacteria bacterium]